MLSYSVIEFGRPVVAMDLPDPKPVGTEVVVEVTHSGVCHTDLHLQDGYYDLGGGKRLDLRDRGVTPPVTLGHEIVGTLIAAGQDADVPDDHFGRSFVVYPWLGCGTCDVCLRGQENLCATPGSVGVFRPGGYAERCLIPHPRHLVEVLGIDPALAATYACSGLTAYSALRKVDIDRERDLLLITGLGGVGFNALQIARSQGYGRIAVVDTDPAKREQARALSGEVTEVIDPADPGAAARLAELGGVAAAIDFVGMRATVEFAVAALRKGGTCVVVGLFGGDVTLPIPPLVQRSIALRGSYVGSPAELRELLELAGSGRIPPLPIEPLPFAAVNDALDRLRAGSVHGRLVLSRKEV